MMRSEINNSKWVTLGAIAIALLSLYPQLVMWGTRGGSWNGAYAQIQSDEWFYSAYIQALIDGRPRISDPYTGLDDQPGKREPESFQSIQFVPAYIIAVPARLFGASSSTAFIVLGFVASLLSYAAIYFLLRNLIKDDRVAAVGALLVLCFGTLAARQGLIHLASSGHQYLFLPFLRRYEPALPFPLFFVFCLAVWKSLTGLHRKFFWAISSGLVFGLLVYSYFYLWTAALAWLVCLTLVWVVANPKSFRQQALLFVSIYSIAAASLVPYFYLLIKHSPLTEAGQKLAGSHVPDLLRGPEFIGLALILFTLFSVRRRQLDWRSPEILFAISFALMPFAVFNQQVLTGRSLQPFHYEQFIANYVVLVGVVIVLNAVVPVLRVGPQVQKFTAYVLLVSVWWAGMEVALATRVIRRNNDFAELAAAVGKRLRTMANEPSSFSNQKPATPVLTLVVDDQLALMLPTFAPQGVMWAPHFDYLHIGHEEGKERFYKYLYYIGETQDQLDKDLRQPMSSFAGTAFGHERVIPDLSITATPITDEDVKSELAAYEKFCREFSRERAARHVISFVVAPLSDIDFSNLDRWYERDQGERIGSFIVYRVRLRE